MREIKFRGKTERLNEWVYGSIVQADVMLEGKHTIIYSDHNGFYCEDEVNPQTVGQYTGLKDKNGKEIYEGDIVSFPSYKNTTSYEKVQFYIAYGQVGLNPFTHSCDGLSADYCEVIGNVYENPNLLEETK